MAVQIVPYGPEHEPLVRAFNQRLHEAGSTWGFYEDHVPDWIPREPGRKQSVWRDYYIAVENAETVRGAYCLKPQAFLIDGKRVTAANWQGPVSEGEVDRRFALLALQMMRDMERREPLLFCWGASDRMCELLERMSWQSRELPFLFRVVNARAFLRRNAFLRREKRRRQGLDVAAFTGVGALGLGALQTWPRVRAGRVGCVRTIVEPSFGAWADELWEANRGRYSILAVRDAATLNNLLPQRRWPDALVLRVVRDRRTVGWAAVRDHQMEDDVRFGDLRVGSVIDALAAPADARLVTRAATRFLEQRGVDLIATNFSHPAWLSAFRASGFIILRERRLFAVSKSFSATVPNLESLLDGMHLTPLDGDGPRGL